MDNFNINFSVAGLVVNASVRLPSPEQPAQVKLFSLDQAPDTHPGIVQVQNNPVEHNPIQNLFMNAAAEPVKMDLDHSLYATITEACKKTAGVDLTGPILLFNETRPTIDPGTRKAVLYSGEQNDE